MQAMSLGKDDAHVLWQRQAALPALKSTSLLTQYFTSILHLFPAKNMPQTFKKHTVLLTKRRSAHLPVCTSLKGHIISLSY
jgi:hypothetical protein